MASKQSTNDDGNPPQKKRPRSTHTPVVKHTPPKATGWDWFRSIGSPRFILSPMVGQSELAFRLLTRKHGAQLTYTPMFIASKFATDATYRKTVFQYDKADRPLVVQFCATSPDDFVSAARHVVEKCDAIELNLGCPQEVAQRGGYGSWMMENQPLIQSILTTATTTLPVPITAKIRMFATFQETLAYCQMLQGCGISMLTIHPRMRHHREEVLSDWQAVVSLRAHLSIPVVLNGDLWSPEILAVAMATCSVDGYMCAQGALHNPAIFESLLPYADYNRPLPNENANESGGEDDQGTSGGNSEKGDMDDASNTERPIEHDSKRARAPGNGSGARKQSTSKGAKTKTQQQQAPSRRGTTTTTTTHSPQFKFVSTQSPPYDHPELIRFYRLRPRIPTRFLSPPPSTATMAAQPTTAPLSEHIRTTLMSFTKEQLSEGQAYIGHLPVTIPSAHTDFVKLIYLTETTLDRCKRQLRLAVEYLDLIAKHPVPHHAVSSRHIFFILFDLFQKYVDAYDQLHSVDSPDQYKPIIHLLMQRAAIGADPALIKTKTPSGIVRNHRRDGTLAPPPWPAGGGGFNVATANPSKKKLAPTVMTHANKQIAKKVDLSRFD